MIRRTVFTKRDTTLIIPGLICCPLLYRLSTLIVILLSIHEMAAGENSPEQFAAEENVYLKIDQGFSWGILSDQRMSELHYKGPGGILNFGRYKRTSGYISEWSFARLQYNHSKPEHKNTIVENPGAGIRYLHLRNIGNSDRYNIYLGGEANIYANFRIARRLSNSFLFADMAGEIRPQAQLFVTSNFLNREWNIELATAASLAGYSVRIPEYGVSFELDSDGGIKIQGFEQGLLTPFNYNHITTGMFLRGYFPGSSNPNWFRIGYIWDYYNLRGAHELVSHNAAHQFVLELYFRVK